MRRSQIWARNNLLPIVMGLTITNYNRQDFSQMHPNLQRILRNKVVSYMENCIPSNTDEPITLVTPMRQD